MGNASYPVFCIIALAIDSRRDLKVQFKRLSPYALGLWDGKITRSGSDQRVEFNDSSKLWRVADDERSIRGLFFGRGLLGVTSNVDMAIQEWFRLPKTPFQVGLAAKQLVPEDSLELQPYTSSRPGYRKFACGSVLEFTFDTVWISVTGEGLLVVRYNSSKSAERFGPDLEGVNVLPRHKQPLKARPGARSLVGAR